MNKFTLCLVVLLVLLIGCAPKQHEFIANDINSQDLLAHLKTLTSDEFGGRRPGTPGDEITQQYISNVFKQSGLKPIGDDGTYLQHFTFLSNVKIGENNKLVVTIGDKTLPLKFNDDFRPMGFSQDTSVSGPMAFVGYGISTDSMNYDDYKGIDVKGKIVVMLRYSPSPDKKKDEFEKYSSIRVKAFTAREKGAAGIIIVTGPLDDEESKLMAFTFDRNFGTSGIASLTMKWTSFDSILHLTGKDLKTIQQEINSTKSPRSFD
jgi:aminopeptidase YwaD